MSVVKIYLNILLKVLFLTYICSRSPVADTLLRALRSAGVSVFGGDRAMKAGLTERAVESFRYAYYFSFKILND